MEPVVEQFMSVLEPCGLNLYGVVSAESYDRNAEPALRTSVIAPGTRSIIVFASAGKALWRSFLNDLTSHPGHLVLEQDPLDAYVERCLGLATEYVEGVAHRWFTSTDNSAVHLDFRTLAVDAGLAVPSKLGLVIRPDVGPWLGLRAACFTDAEIAPSKPLDEICVGCHAPCASACPGDAFVAGVWDVQRCVEFHQLDDRCAQGCDARVACPIGSGHRYTAMQRLYHYDRKTGRRVLAQHLGIEGDLYEGVGPDWGLPSDSTVEDVPKN